jgi:hypothetical protein
MDLEREGKERNRREIGVPSRSVKTREGFQGAELTEGGFEREIGWKVSSLVSREREERGGRESHRQ